MVLGMRPDVVPQDTMPNVAGLTVWGGRVQAALLAERAGPLRPSQDQEEG
jgi:hypothetical protein